MNKRTPIRIITPPPTFITVEEYFKIHLAVPRKNANTKNGIAKPRAYAVVKPNHVPGSEAAKPRMAVSAGPIQGVQPAEKPIPNINELI